ncbi:MAG: hypothetical protein J1F23_08195 [Oscillospiraceae bacterium]|nr:hypothetical protein [Oscillospiraceae bacterium]
MNNHIEFELEYCDNILLGKTVITKDESIVFQPFPPICSFSIHPYDWSFELTTQQISENKYLICCALASLCFFKCESANLTMPRAQKGKIFVHLNFSHADGIYYSNYAPFACKKFYDPQNKIFAVGDITATGKSIEFADGQIAVFNGLGSLTAVYINISQ